MKFAFAAAALFCCSFPAQAAPEAEFMRAEQRVSSLFEAVRSEPGAPPAMALVMVAEGTKPVILVTGTADLRTKAKADADTPFYIASMTKAYLGLLAVELDRQGVLDLDSTMASHWPNLKMAGVDTKAMTLRDLLSHRMLFTNNTLTFKTAYVGEVAPGDYPAALAEYSEARKPGFAYDNLGYVLYGAILEKQTGRSWKDWLKMVVFKPLGMNHTSARSSDFPIVAAAHQWGESGWHTMPAKPDSIMHPAGGLMTSANDMARWLKAQVQGATEGISPETFAAAHRAVPYPETDRGGRVCDGYSFGWNRCKAHGVTFLEHGGGYTGFRSQMMIVPDRKIGFAVLTNSDSMTGALSSDLMMEFVEAIGEPGSPAPDAESFASDYAKSVSKQAEGRRKREEKDRADPKWQGWLWKPSTSDLETYVGRYRSERLGDMVVRREKGTLLASLGEVKFDMVPAAPDLFAGIRNPMETRDLLLFERKHGRPTAMLWGDRRFERVR